MTSSDTRLVGTWRRIPKEDEAGIENLVEFTGDGSLFYSIELGNSTQQFALLYETSEGVISTRQTSGEPAHQAAYRFEGDDLVMSLGPDEFRYVRFA